jgi:cell division protein FtsI/penicillin-binding protein 2
LSSPPISAIRPASRQAGGRRDDRRRKRLARILPLAAVAFAAFAIGIAAGSRDDQLVGERYVAAWSRADYHAMHALLAPASQRRWPLRRFERDHRRAAATGTLAAVRAAGKVRREGDAAEVVPILARTRAFGTLKAELRLPVETVDGRHVVRWASELVFPGLRKGERLRRQTSLPARGTLQARDGTVLAEGSARGSDLGPLAAEVAGRVGAIPPEDARRYEALGYPDGALVGLTGLEKQFEDRLRGRFGGVLRAGGRVLAHALPQTGSPVRTSIDPDVQRAAVEALAGRLGGAAVIRPATGEVLALAGLATAAPQPPGSTFKVITLAAALDDGVVKPTSAFPVQTATTIEGVELQNANGESCGGTLSNSFAHSCNSVFAPMGVQLGAQRLVRAAERFGFNEVPAVAGALAPTIPAAGEIGDDLAVGSTAIGQGRVLSTPLHLAMVAGAIANRGRLVRPTLEKSGQGRSSAAVSERAARTVARFMRRVVESGTGSAARIAGVSVAGKTGTAELRDTTRPDTQPPPGEESVKPDDKSDTDAWFIAFAPASKPRVAVAVLLVGAGAGGETAAPAARQILLTALKARRS